MRLDQAGYNFIAKKEGFCSKPYPDSVGVATIGHGTIRYPNGVKVTLKDKPINEATAMQYLKHYADDFAVKVYKYVGNIEQNKFNALVSFTYNLGIKPKFLNFVAVNPNNPSIADYFKKFVWGGGKKIQGLMTRREDEVMIYFQKKKFRPVRLWKPNTNFWSNLFSYKNPKSKKFTT